MAIIGDYVFAKWDGPPPPLPAPSVETFEVAGYPYLGAASIPLDPTSATVTLTAYVVSGLSSSLIASYNTYIGTSRAVYHARMLYALAPHSVLHFVESMEVVRVRTVIRARGVLDNGSRFDLWPAEEVVTRWTLRPVPVPVPED